MEKIGQERERLTQIRLKKEREEQEQNEKEKAERQNEMMKIAEIKRLEMEQQLR